MKVFHGSTSIVDKPLANIGRNHLDFGKGFYLTTLENQAISWASRPLNQADNQICVLNQNIIDNHLTFVEAREIKEEEQ